MNDKWLMFKNYMHNELGITREDIRQWIEDAVKKEAESMVKNEFNKFNPEKIVTQTIFSDRYFASDSLKKEILYELSKQIMEKISFNSNTKND